MHHFKLVAVIFAVVGFLLPNAAVHAETETVLAPAPGGISLLGDKPEATFKFSGGSLGTSSIVDVQGMPFLHAVEMKTLQQPEKMWGLQIHQAIPQAFKKGDVIWISVWMRATETSNEEQEGLSQLTVDQSQGNHGRLAIFDLNAGSKWQQYAWAFTATEEGPAGTVQLSFRGGFKPQTIQLGGLQILNYGPSVQVSSLPHTLITYAGIEPDAPWRKAAAERIDKFRKADIKIDVKDAAGKPLAGATVKILETRAAFGFGSCIVPQVLLSQGPDGDHYREIVKNDYSKAVLENALKWRFWEESAAKDGNKETLASLKWLQEAGIPIRGHNLIWPGWRFTPKDVQNLKNDKVALEKRIEDHFQDEVTALKGQIVDWDVVNEPFSQHEIVDILGPSIMTDWFKLVHKIDPKPDLYLNDFAGFMSKGADTPHKDASEKMLRNLKSEGAPLTGVGIQSHFGSQLTPPELVLKELDRWAAIGLQVQITEFDIDLPDEEMQARYMHDFMTACFSHPAVNCIMLWGFWEGAHWRPRAALYRKDWTIKPNGQAWNDLVLKEWHTDQTLTTNASGSVSTRGFMGDYQIVVTYQAKTQTFRLTLPKEGATLSAVMAN